MLPKSKVYSSFATACLLLCASYTAQAGCSKPIEVGYSDWRGGKESIKAPFTDIEIVRLIFDTAGCELRIHVAPLVRIRNDIRFGKTDSIASASITPERQEYSWFSLPYRKEKLTAFMRSSEVRDFHPAEMKDLFSNDKRVGVATGYWLGKKFESMMGNNPEFERRLLRSDDYPTMYRWLLHGRVDIVINHSNHGILLIKTNPTLEGISPHSFTINEDDVHLMFSKKSVARKDIEILNQAILELQATRKYHMILEQFNNPK